MAILVCCHLSVKLKFDRAHVRLTKANLNKLILIKRLRRQRIQSRLCTFWDACQISAERKNELNPLTKKNIYFALRSLRAVHFALCFRK